MTPHILPDPKNQLAEYQNKLPIIGPFPQKCRHIYLDRGFAPPIHVASQFFVYRPTRPGFCLAHCPNSHNAYKILDPHSVSPAVDGSPVSMLLCQARFLTPINTMVYHVYSPTQRKLETLEIRRHQSQPCLYQISMGADYRMTIGINLDIIYPDTTWIQLSGLKNDTYLKNASL